MGLRIEHCLHKNRYPQKTETRDFLLCDFINTKRIRFFAVLTCVFFYNKDVIFTMWICIMNMHLFTIRMRILTMRTHFLQQGCKIMKMRMLYFSGLTLLILQKGCELWTMWSQTPCSYCKDSPALIYFLNRKIHIFVNIRPSIVKIHILLFWKRKTFLVVRNSNCKKITLSLCKIVHFEKHPTKHCLNKNEGLTRWTFDTKIIVLLLGWLN